MCASRAERSEGGDLAASAMLNASRIGEEAERAALSLPFTGEKVFESYYTYLTVDEPAVHLMPLHFLPPASREQVGEGSLRELAVAGKLEYARNRWLDEMVDHPGSTPGLHPAHRLNDALITLINSRYAGVLDGAAAASFFPVLSVLHARHGLSLILDGARFRGVIPPLTLETYAEHARTRHGPVRAPVDAVLLLTGASESLLRRARSSWHNWALGVQFYDDALDVEEDFTEPQPDLGSGAYSPLLSSVLRQSRHTEDAGSGHVLRAGSGRGCCLRGAEPRGVILRRIRRASRAGLPELGTFSEGMPEPGQAPARGL